MKTGIIIFILFCTNSVFAQYPILSTTNLANPNADINFGKRGNYSRDVNNERDQYVGLWRFNENGILFELKIEKRDQFINKIEYQGQTWYTYSDVVIFKYKLIKNGILIYDNLSSTIPEKYISIASKSGIDNFLYGGFLDTTRNVCANVTIEKTSSSPERIFFNLSSGAYYLLNPPSFYEGSNEQLFNVPTDGIEMERVY